MAEEQEDRNQRGWFARWRERRKHASKTNSGLSEMKQHEIMVRSKDAQAARKILRRPG